MGGRSVVSNNDRRQTPIAEFVERHPCCQLCRCGETGLEFHHWDYENDIGCYLCTECHEKIHTDSARPTEVGPVWIWLAVRNTIDRYYQIHDQVLWNDTAHNELDFPRWLIGERAWNRVLTKWAKENQISNVRLNESNRRVNTDSTEDQ